MKRWSLGRRRAGSLTCGGAGGSPLHSRLQAAGTEEEGKNKGGGQRRRGTSRSVAVVGSFGDFFPRRSDFLFVALLSINSFYFGIVHFLSGDVSWLQFSVLTEN